MNSTTVSKKYMKRQMITKSAKLMMMGVTVADLRATNSKLV